MNDTTMKNNTENMDVVKMNPQQALAINGNRNSGTSAAPEEVLSSGTAEPSGARVERNMAENRTDQDYLRAADTGNPPIEPGTRIDVAGRSKGEKHELKEVRAIAKTLDEADRQAKRAARTNTNPKDIPPPNIPKRGAGVFPTEKFRSERPTPPPPVERPTRKEFPDEKFRRNRVPPSNVPHDQQQAAEVQSITRGLKRTQEERDSKKRARNETEAQPTITRDLERTQEETVIVPPSIVPDDQQQPGAFPQGNPAHNPLISEDDTVPDRTNNNESNPHEDDAHDDPSTSPHDGLLLEATLVPHENEEDRPEPIEAEAVLVDSGFLAFAKSTKGGMLLCFGISLLVAAMITVGVICGNGSCSASSDNPVAPPTIAPTREPSSLSPTATPTRGLPSQAPTLTFVPSQAPTLSAQPTSNYVRDVVKPVARYGGAEWDNPENYQAKAINWLVKDAFSTTLSEERIQQRYALACIYYATGAVATAYTVNDPRGWIGSFGWLSALSECTWFGLDCNENDQVTRIDLASNRLTGTFPPETAIMSGSVTRIDLFRNAVYNSGDEGNGWLGEMTNLQSLFLGQTNFEYNGIPPQISQLTNLQEYDCSYTRYSGPLQGSTFASLINLEYLVLSGNEYNSTLPVEIGHLPNLTFFYATDARVEGDLSFMESMKSIKECWVDRNPDLGGQIPPSIGNLSTLQSWSISRCGLSGTIPSELGLLTQMRRMWMYGNSLTGTMPDSICENFNNSLETLVADCLDVDCSCCTECGPPE